jgi:hypothetical protein
VSQSVMQRRIHRNIEEEKREIESTTEKY